MKMISIRAIGNSQDYQTVPFTPILAADSSTGERIQIIPMRDSVPSSLKPRVTRAGEFVVGVVVV